MENLRAVSDSAEKANWLRCVIKRQVCRTAILDEISSVEDHIKQIEKAISNLASDKDRLDRVNERPILISIVKYVFGDAEREESERIQKFKRMSLAKKMI